MTKGEDKMLKLSTKGRYGVRAMFELALSYGQGPILMGKIAAEQGLSRKYLHALLTSLKKSGLVTSVRGAKGGYMLAKPPHEINLTEIIESLEGPLSIVHCVRDQEKCPRSDECSVQPLWGALNAALEQTLSRFTLADLITNRQTLREISLERSELASDQGPSA